MSMTAFVPDLMAAMPTVILTPSAIAKVK